MSKLPKVAWVGIAVVLVFCCHSNCLDVFGSSTAMTKEGTGFFAYSTDFPDLDPSIAFENEHVILANVYEALVYYDARSKDPLKPWLATSWSETPDGLKWTFKLRDDVKFHDGTRFTAEAVKFAVAGRRIEVTTLFEMRQEKRVSNLDCDITSLA